MEASKSSPRSRLRVEKSAAREALLSIGPAVVAAAVFLAVLHGVVSDTAGPFDHAVMGWVRRFDSPAADVVMRALTIVGKLAIVLPAAAAVAVWAWSAGSRRLATTLVAVSIASVLLMNLLKVLLQRERPDLFFEITAPTSFSFPSGHALLAVAVYGFAAMVVARLRPGVRPAMVLFAPPFIAGIGISRVYLGVHWPTDVLAGFAAGALLLIGARHALGQATSEDSRP